MRLHSGQFHVLRPFQPRKAQVPLVSRLPYTGTSRWISSVSSTPSKTQSSSLNTPLAQRIPKGTWDTHMHVLDPVNFPLSPKASYIPSAHTLEDSKPFYSSLGIQNLVLVQPSIYGTDNSCVLSALEALGPDHGRAVVEIDPDTISPSTLREWHNLGVRGVRINLRSSGIELGKPGQEWKDVAQSFTKDVKRYADLIRPLKWSLDFHISMDTIPLLHFAAPELGVKLCIDHFGSPDLPPKSPPKPWHTSGPWALNGFSHLVDLLKSSRTPTYIKISAPYRFSSDLELRDIERLTKELLKEAPDRCVFATDWPHTRFEGENVEPFVEGCLTWAEEVGGSNLVESLFQTNAERLLDGTY